MPWEYRRITAVCIKGVAQVPLIAPLSPCAASGGNYNYIKTERGYFNYGKTVHNQVGK